MLFLLIRKEIAHNVLSLRFAVTYALLFLLVLMSLFLMTGDYKGRRQEYNSALAKERAQLAKLEAIQDPSELLQEYQRASFTGVREPSGLSILARGLDAVMPTRVVSSGYLRFLTSEDRLNRNKFFEIFQAPDLVYVVNVVASLLALLFVFDAICGEKERGTLKLLLANSVPRDLILLGKWIGGYLSLAVPLVAAALAGLIYVRVSGAMTVGGEEVTRFLLILGLALLYLSACFTLGLMISTLTHRPATSLLVCLLVWIGGILIVPNLAPVVGRLAAPIPDRQVIEAEKQAINREMQLLQEALSRRKIYGGGQESEQLQQDAGRRVQKLEEFYQDRLASQVSMTQNLARISPSASFLFAATGLAGTGTDLSRQFTAARERYQKAFSEQQMNLNRTLYQSGRVQFTNGRMEVKDRDWFKPDELPRFTMAAESLGDSLSLALFDLLLLAVANVLVFLLAFVFFLRYDVT